MAKLFNLACMTTSTTGTGTITLGSAATIGGVTYLSFSAAGVADGDIVRYAIMDTNASEIGYGTYTASGTTLTRNVISSTNSNSAINLSGGAKVFITAAAEDIFTSAPECGRFDYASATAVTFTPFNGNQFKVNGNLKYIPSGGFSGGGNTSVYVNGVSGQNLASSTLYYAYGFDNSGTPTIDWSTTAYAVSTQKGNEGTLIKSGDNTRTLLGLVRTNGSSQFVSSATQRFVLSWFNKRPVGLTNIFTASRNSTTGSSYAEVNSEIRNEFITWANEAVHVGVAGGGFLNVSSDQVYVGVAFDGATPEEGALPFQGTLAIGPLGLYLTKSGLSEGYHYSTLTAKQTVGSSAFTFVSGATGQRCSLSTMIRG